MMLTVHEQSDPQVAKNHVNNLVTQTIETLLDGYTRGMPLINQDLREAWKLNSNETARLLSGMSWKGTHGKHADTARDVAFGMLILAVRKEE